MTLDELNKMYEVAEKRCRKTGKLARVHSGMYLGLVNDRVWQFKTLFNSGAENLNDVSWIATCGQPPHNDYTDSYETLKELKQAMGL